MSLFLIGKKWRKLVEQIIFNITTSLLYKSFFKKEYTEEKCIMMLLEIGRCYHGNKLKLQQNFHQQIVL